MCFMNWRFDGFKQITCNSNNLIHKFFSSYWKIWLVLTLDKFSIYIFSTKYLLGVEKVTSSECLKYACNE